MTFKLITAVALSLSLFSCKSSTETTDTKSSAPASVVTEDLNPIIKKLDGDKYVSTELSGDTDYFIVYVTASW